MIHKIERFMKKMKWIDQMLLKLLLKIKKPLGLLVEIWFMIWKYKNVEKRIEKMENIDEEES